MAWWRRQTGDGSFPKTDAGSGSLDDYQYGLQPRKGKVVIRLAGSDPYQAELASLMGDGDLFTAGGQRTMEEERTDAPIHMRLFTGTKVTGVVGTVPRGLEGAVTEALSRLESRGEKPRIPVQVVRTKNGLRVELLMWATR
ncbi:hypothetical protein ACFSBZ_00645 [Amnibacterium flavum]|uniref:Uncharacterized protein n=1 Tax=Amnibacterium flavum TaxID=2173173 RepID=A0A2V1HM14_9MICO|nr:hypothetical protein [Amnibacterium flavum]PVZ93568.1 hypothetical protein DDQ50_14740 [Amnibacterium flavum]